MAVTWAGLTGSVPVLAGAGGAFWWGARWAFDARGVVVSPLLPWLTLASSFVALVLVRYLAERGRADRATRDLGQTRELVLQALTSLTETDGLVELAEDTTTVAPGSTVAFLSYATLAA